MIKVKYTEKFSQELEITIDNHEASDEEVENAIAWFENNPQDTRLETHALSKRMKDKWSFSVNDDVRIIFKWQGKKNVRFLRIGPHHLVYRRN